MYTEKILAFTHLRINHALTQENHKFFTSLPQKRMLQHVKIFNFTQENLKFFTTLPQKVHVTPKTFKFLQVYPKNVCYNT